MRRQTNRSHTQNQQEGQDEAKNNCRYFRHDNVHYPDCRNCPYVKPMIKVLNEKISGRRFPCSARGIAGRFLLSIYD